MSPVSPVPLPAASPADGAAPPASVVGDGDPQQVSSPGHGHLGLARLRVLDDVGQRLGDDEVGDGLDARRGRFAAASTRSLTGSGARAARPDSAASRPRSFSTAGCSPLMNSRTSDSASMASSCASAIARMNRLWHFGETRPGHAEVHRQRDQPLLGAVVQVTLDPAALGVGRARRSRPCSWSATRAGARAPRSGSVRAATAPAPRRCAQSGARARARRTARRGTRAGGRPAARPTAGRRSGSRSRERRQPAGDDEAGAGAGDDRQGVEGDLPPRARGQPGADRPWRAAGGPRTRGKVHACHGAQPGSLERRHSLDGPELEYGSDEDVRPRTAPRGPRRQVRSPAPGSRRPRAGRSCRPARCRQSPRTARAPRSLSHARPVSTRAS